jgi:Transposase DDE domain/Transposase domain (DUF772)
MFRKNKSHLQPLLISNVQQLPQRQRERLEQSWAGVFYRDVFCHLREEPFAILYADLPSRPNIPVNQLVGLECLKSGFGWSDEELYDAFLYNMQVRYALGLHELGEGEFDLRTLYYFRQRLSQYAQKSGIHLLDQAFEQVTDAQIRAYQLKTGQQRMDSTQVASNIRQQGRLQLLVEVLQRVYRMLSETDQQKYSEVFAPYLKGHPGHYIYRLKKEEHLEHIERAGLVMHRLLNELRVDYAEQPVFQMLERVFVEHFRLEEGGIKVKEHKELSACSLQSPDDWEATIRTKGYGLHQGYVANLTETCDKQNPFQLITKVQVDPNHTDDPQLLVEALPNLAERTEINTLYTDGGYGSPDADQALIDQKVVLLQTAIRGRPTSSEKLGLSDFQYETDPDGKPIFAICPHEQRVPVRLGNQKKGFTAEFDPSICQTCPLIEKCPSKPGKRNPHRFLNFFDWEAHVTQRRQRNAKFQKTKQNPRAAIEATVRAVKHPFPNSKLPVRGKFRIFHMIIGSAVMNNVRQIQRHWMAKKQEERKKSVQDSKQTTLFSFQKFFIAVCQPLFSF